MKQFALMISCTALMAFMVGCAAPEAEGTEPKADETTSSTESTDGSGDMQLVEYRNADGKLVCPLMGSVIEEESEVISWVEHDGKKYAMCCTACADAGKKDPAMVAEKAASL